MPELIRSGLQRLVKKLGNRHSGGGGSLVLELGSGMDRRALLWLFRTRAI